ncbi:uncharacterized protein SCDLUD_004541 [Saccharomycodes ludwigii]|uniref:uncharacterized protein n=1 Tax=Saccharomycodes ludwigii TaxID=36035 RepID=UPI001E835054|nr:hypothetical protein SCDLUD_004541 [Saccharomycodes ludwigii]KAH3899115.1 hypothetical protein SCDLUD_004541 [Saccharomycodes ludwigii]
MCVNNDVHGITTNNTSIDLKIVTMDKLSKHFGIYYDDTCSIDENTANLICKSLDEIEYYKKKLQILNSLNYSKHVKYNSTSTSVNTSGTIDTHNDEDNTLQMVLFSDDVSQHDDYFDETTVLSSSFNNNNTDHNLDGNNCCNEDLQVHQQCIISSDL